eukprot:CAMPEP_0170541778 /NCGR_PEP_ID=MMETSP0211-20121228/1418_1 /TAXON_ID=311385 /ORGANISM="Pseudokeronopsis sp., Strain OXSARD2" /LENGTH=146 /DNA_ID=CAMNT_0010844633 /DNA_START=509 /DNA_END=949 /DNA_ORIENTATION=-
MFDQSKQDPNSVLEERKDDEDIVISDYIFSIEEENTIKTDAFYCTKLGQIKGVLYLKPGLLQFDPLVCEENDYLFTDKKMMSTFQVFVDYNDVSECEMLKLMNESAVMVENNFIKEAYRYDYFIQIDLHTVNGLTLKSSQKDGYRI